MSYFVNLSVQLRRYTYVIALVGMRVGPAPLVQLAVAGDGHELAVSGCDVREADIAVPILQLLGHPQRRRAHS